MIGHVFHGQAGPSGSKTSWAAIWGSGFDWIAQQKKIKRVSNGTHKSLWNSRIPSFLSIAAFLQTFQKLSSPGTQRIRDFPISHITVNTQWRRLRSYSRLSWGSCFVSLIAAPGPINSNNSLSVVLQWCSDSNTKGRINVVVRRKCGAEGADRDPVWG